MKTERKLSGVFFKYKGKTICFEELPEERQDEILETMPIETVHSLVKQFANVLNKIGDEFNIIAE